MALNKILEKIAFNEKASLAIPALENLGLGVLAVPRIVTGKRQR